MTNQWNKVDIDDYVLNLSDVVSLYVYCPREGAKWKWSVNGMGKPISGRRETEIDAKREAVFEARREAYNQRYHINQLISDLDDLIERSLGESA